jgi:hypothetical protein
MYGVHPIFRGHRARWFTWAVVLDRHRAPLRPHDTTDAVDGLVRTCALMRWRGVESFCSVLGECGAVTMRCIVGKAKYPHHKNVQAFPQNPQ